MNNFYKGTIENFNTWHSLAKIDANMPLGGFITIVNSREDTNEIKSDKLSIPILHPINSNDYVWEYNLYPKPELGLTEYTISEVIINGYLIDPDA